MPFCTIVKEQLNGNGMGTGKSYRDGGGMGSTLIPCISMVYTDAGSMDNGTPAPINLLYCHDVEYKCTSDMT